RALIPWNLGCLGQDELAEIPIIVDEEHDLLDALRLGNLAVLERADAEAVVENKALSEGGCRLRQLKQLFYPKTRSFCYLPNFCKWKVSPASHSKIMSFSALTACGRNCCINSFLCKFAPFTLFTYSASAACTFLCKSSSRAAPCFTPPLKLKAGLPRRCGSGFLIRSYSSARLSYLAFAFSISASLSLTCFSLLMPYVFQCFRPRSMLAAISIKSSCIWCKIGRAHV